MRATTEAEQRQGAYELADTTYRKKVHLVCPLRAAAREHQTLWEYKRNSARVPRPLELKATGHHSGRGS